jgi:hypothetical protein
MMEPNSNSVATKPPRWVVVGTENTKNWQKEKCNEDADWNILFLFEFNERNFYDPDAPVQKRELHRKPPVFSGTGDYHEFKESLHAAFITNKAVNWITKHQQLLAHLSGQAKDCVKFLKPRGRAMLVQSMEYLDKEYGAPTQRKGAMMKRLKLLKELDQGSLDSLMAAKYLFKEIIMYYEEFDPMSVKSMLASDALIQNVKKSARATMAYNLFRSGEHLANSVQTLTRWIDDVTFIAREEQYDHDIGTDDTKNKSPVMFTEQTSKPVEEDQGEQSEAGGEVSESSELPAEPKRERHQTCSFLIGGSRPFSCCPDCGGQHHLPGCQKWTKNDLKDKKKSAFRMGACYRCLKGVHTGLECETEEVCAICGSTRHHTVLHEDKYTPKKPEVVATVTTTPKLTTSQKDKLSNLQDLSPTEREQVLKEVAGTVLDVVLNGVKAGGVNLHVNVKTPASDNRRITVQGKTKLSEKKPGGFLGGVKRSIVCPRNQENQDIIDAIDQDLPVILKDDEKDLDGTSKLVGLHVVSGPTATNMGQSPHEDRESILDKESLVVQTTYKVEEFKVKGKNE